MLFLFYISFIYLFLFFSSVFLLRFFLLLYGEAFTYTLTWLKTAARTVRVGLEAHSDGVRVESVATLFSVCRKLYRVFDICCKSAYWTAIAMTVAIWAGLGFRPFGLLGFWLHSNWKIIKVKPVFVAVSQLWHTKRCWVKFIETLKLLAHTATTTKIWMLEKGFNILWQCLKRIKP